jgi:hypothetical protein
VLHPSGGVRASGDEEEEEEKEEEEACSMRIRLQSIANSGVRYS